MLSIIVAMSQNRVIGLNNQLPWHLSEDLKNFKKITMGHTIVMGRKTFDSIAKALPGRTNVILTSDPSYHAEGIQVIHNFDALVKLGKTEEEVFIIGGAKVYEQSLKYVNNIYMTLIKKDFTGDAFFPEIDFVKKFKIVEESEVFISKNGLPYQFIVAQRN